jgi:hypothetical protein
MFLFSDTGLHDTAYFITPDENGESIRHQYGCVGCSQFEIRGRLEKVPEDVAKKLEELLGCEYAEPAVISLQTGLEVDYVLGESLARLKDGRYVATCNCD